jgi:hypothetical protein
MPITKHVNGLYRVVNYPVGAKPYWTDSPVPQLLSWWTRRQQKRPSQRRPTKVVIATKQKRKRKRTRVVRDNVFDVSKITAVRPVVDDPTTNEYFVHFLGYDESEARWTPKHDITPSAIRAFTDVTTIDLVDKAYDTNTVQARGHKIRANDMFIDAMLVARKYRRNLADWMVVVLDGEDANTTFRLLDAGLVTPLVTVNFTKPVADKITSLLETVSTTHDISNVRVVCSSIANVIADAEPDSLGAVWFDYCSTFKGTKACYPKKDITALFADGALRRDRSVVALTVCLRDNRMNGHSATHAVQIRAIHEFLFRLARKHDYTDIRVCNKLKYGTMYVVVLEFGRP